MGNQQKSKENFYYSLALLAVLLGVSLAYTYGMYRLLQQPVTTPKKDSYQLLAFHMEGELIYPIDSNKTGLRHGELRVALHAAADLSVYQAWLSESGQPSSSLPEIVLKHVNMTKGQYRHWDFSLELRDAKFRRLAFLVCAGHELLSPYLLEKAFQDGSSCYLHYFD